MSEIECKNCKLYYGNCGYHHVDILTNHINYEIPAECMYVNNVDPACFVPAKIEFNGAKAWEESLRDRGDEFLKINDIVDRFKKIDDLYNNTSWTLKHIFANLSMIKSIEIKEK